MQQRLIKYIADEGRYDALAAQFRNVLFVGKVVLYSTCTQHVLYSVSKNIL